MSIQDSINLFNTKINSTLWTRQEFSPTGRLLRTVQNPVVLPEEKYYKILQKKFVKVGGNTGYVPAFNKQNIADYYANERTGDAIAVVRKPPQTLKTVTMKITKALQASKALRIMRITIMAKRSNTLKLLQSTKIQSTAKAASPQNR